MNAERSLSLYLSLCRLADTVHLVHIVSSVTNEVVYEMARGLMEKLAVEALQVAMVKCVARIVQGEAGKAICKETERLKPAVVVMGSRGRGLIQRTLKPCLDLITLSGKPLEGTETTTNGTTVCPLQGYLFGSATEFPGATTVAKKAHRTSLGELFQMTKMAGESSSAKFEEGEKITDKESEKSTVPLIKKMLKRRMIHPSSRSSTGAVDSTSAETKLHKILQMFHKKVHPESTRAKRKASKTQKKNIKNISRDSGYKNGDWMDPNEHNTTFSQKRLSKERRRRSDCQSNPQVFTLDGSDSNGNREYWIKTDAD